MTTPSNHIQRRQPQCAKHPNCRARHSAPQTVILPPIAARPKRRCQTRGQQNSTECDRIRQNPTETRARARATATTPVIPAKAGIPFLQPPASFPRRWESPSCTTPVIPAKAGIPFPRHVLRPGHSGLDASLGIAVLSPSCQQIERNRFGVFSLGRGRASRLLVGDALLSGISHIMAPQHLDNILE